MQLPDQLLKKLRLLTDKPISPMVNKQLHPLLLHQNLPLQKSLQTLTQKYRSDLLIHLLQNNRFPSQNSINAMLVSIQNNILMYKLAEVLQVYILVLTKIGEDKKMLEIGYYDLIKLAVKLPNLETKERLFQILVSNFQFFYKGKLKKIILAVVANFIEIYAKFLMYVPSYVSFAELVLQVDRFSKQILNKPHPERAPKLQQILIDLSSKQLSTMATQTVQILLNTKQKQNYYALHKNCLNVLKKIGQTLTNFQIKESQLNFTEIDVGNIIRCIQNFHERKGTIDEAKFAKIVWVKRWNSLKNIKEMKTQKYMNREFSGPLFLDKKQIDKPLLIQDVISMANNYRLKYQVAPVPDQQQASPSRIVAVSNNFLRKGIGAGGGRTHLLNKKHQSVFKTEKDKNKRLYEDLLHKCFSQYGKDLQYKSFVDPKLIKDEQNLETNREGEFTIQQPQNLQLQQSKLSVQQVDNLPIFIADRTISHRNQETLNRSKVSSAFEDDQEIEQINNLIQLAYSYKFS